MKLQDAVIQCDNKKCGHKFQDQLLVQCSVERFCAAIKAMRCPKCNGKKLSLVKTESVE